MLIFSIMREDFRKMRRLCRCKDHRALTVGQKNFRSDGFSGRNRLRVENGRNPCVLPELTSSYEGKNSGGIKSPKQRK